jgi:hypothetical protein
MSITILYFLKASPKYLLGYILDNEKQSIELDADYF